MKRKFKLKKEIKENIKAISYTIAIILGMLALMILIGIVENAKF